VSGVYPETRKWQLALGQVVVRMERRLLNTGLGKRRVAVEAHITVATRELVSSIVGCGAQAPGGDAVEGGVVEDDHGVRALHQALHGEQGVVRADHDVLRLLVLVWEDAVGHHHLLRVQVLELLQDERPHACKGHRHGHRHQHQQQRSQGKQPCENVSPTCGCAQVNSTSISHTQP